MIEEKYLNILRCIKCGGTLKQKKTSLSCNKCNYTYSIVDDIPSLVIGSKEMDVQITANKWEQVYRDEEEKLDLEGKRQLESFIQFISSYGNQFKKGLYLDLGCGIARTAPYLVKMGVSYLGSDISMEALRKTKSLLKKDNLNGFFVQADFQNLPIKNNSVNSIFWGQALEYVKDTKKGVSEAHRVLKKGGALVATFPPLSISNITYQQLRGDIPDIPIMKDIIRWVHLNIFKGKYLHYGYGQSLSVKFVEKVFSEAGFKIKKVAYYDTYYPITYLPKILRPLGRKILRLRLFWPVAYIEALKT